MRWFAFLVLTSSFVVSVDATAIDDRIAQLEKDTGSRIGVAAFDLATQDRVVHRATERFLMCSTFKLLAVAAVLQRVDRGEENLDRFVRYSQPDIFAYAPVTKQHVAEGGMKLGDLCEAAIEQSDNTAGNLLLQAIGGPSGLTRFARSIGDDITRVDRTEPQLNIASGDDSDTTSPVAMVNDLMKICTSDLLAEKSRELIEGWLLKTETGVTLIRAGVPKDWRVGDKTGRSGQGQTNDVAILYPPGRERIFVAIYVTAPSLPEEKRSDVVANIARQIVATFPAVPKN